MDNWMDTEDKELPYRHSIDHETYERCGNMYNHYFQELESLGPVDKNGNASICAKESSRKIKVGAKPLSGVRGIYYTRGTWRVQYRGHGQEIVSCVFTYDSKEVLIATFDLAFKLLRRVIQLGRQIKKEDGMIIGHLTEDRLLDLDRRSRIRTVKTSSAPTRDITLLSTKRISRPRHECYNDDFDSDGDSELEASYTVVNKKSCTTSGKRQPYTHPNSKRATKTCIMGPPVTTGPDINHYVGRLSSFERQFQSYGHFTTHELISFLIDEGNMKNSGRATPVSQRETCQEDEMASEHQGDNTDSPNNESQIGEFSVVHPSCGQKSINLHEADEPYNQSFEERFKLKGSEALYSLKASLSSSNIGTQSSCAELTGYDSHHMMRSPSTADEGSPYLSPDRRKKGIKAPPADTRHAPNQHEHFASYYEYDSKCIQQ